MELRKLIQKLAFALMLILAGAALIRHWVDPSPWYGNDIMDEKMGDWAIHHEKFNAAFIGSSIVLRNFDPAHFDSQIPDSLNLKTYNLGIGGTLPPETYKMYEWLMQNHSNGLNHVFVELRDVGMFHPQNLHTLRRRYWMTPKEYTFISRVNLHSSIPSENKRKNIAYYGISLLERMFVVDYFNDLFAHSGEDAEAREYKRQLIRSTAGHGYLPLNGTSMRREQFLMDTTHLFLMAETYRALMEKPELLPRNHPHLQRLLKMIQESEQQGINIYFVLQPKQNILQWKETLGLYYHIPEKNKINLADPDRYPELYWAQYSFSENHFNEPGTHLLSRLLAQEFLHKVKQYPASFIPNQPTRTSDHPNN